MTTLGRAIEVLTEHAPRLRLRASSLVRVARSSLLASTLPRDAPLLAGSSEWTVLARLHNDLVEVAARSCDPRHRVAVLDAASAIMALRRRSLTLASIVDGARKAGHEGEP